MSSTKIGFNQVAQLMKKFEKVGWDASRITQLGQANDKKFRAIESILDGALTASVCVDNDTSHLRFLESTTIAPTKGSVTLAQASDVFTCNVDSDFQNWITDVSSRDTEEEGAHVYEIKKKGNFREIFGSFRCDLRLLCFTQGQIKEFCHTNRHLLQQDGYCTFLLFEVDDEFFVAGVGVVASGELEVSAYRFGSNNVWHADECHRLVVPQQIF